MDETTFSNVSGVIVESIPADPAKLDQSKKSYGYSGMIGDKTNVPEQNPNQPAEEEYPDSAE